MPSTSQRLRDKFLIYYPDSDAFDDGIDRCESIILSYGGHCRRGWIVLPDDFDSRIKNYEYDDFCDAVQYLIEEWDYALEE